MDWETYEETVKNIYAALGARNEVEIVCHGNTCKCLGKSQVNHQIDVITSFTDGIHTYKTAIECKYWNQKINKEIVMKSIGIRNDCDFNKGVIVSRFGFTADAIQYAQHNNIGLIELRDAVEEDFANRVRCININIHLCLPEIKKYSNLRCDINDQKDEVFEVSLDNSYYLFPDKSMTTCRVIVNNFFKELMEHLKVDEVVEKQISFPDGTYFRSPESKLNIETKSVLVSGILNSSKPESLEIRAEDHVWLIMKIIFEKKIFIISSQGEIQEIPFI